MLCCVVRRSQWSGAKALAKLIKPRKESSRERSGGDRDRDKEGDKERGTLLAKCAPDIPLPDPPPLLPPETPPLVPLRTLSDTQDSGHAHGNHNNHVGSLGPHSPALTPISRGKKKKQKTKHIHTLQNCAIISVRNQQRALETIA